MPSKEANYKCIICACWTVVRCEQTLDTRAIRELTPLLNEPTNSYAEPHAQLFDMPLASGIMPSSIWCTTYNVVSPRSAPAAQPFVTSRLLCNVKQPCKSAASDFKWCWNFEQSLKSLYLRVEVAGDFAETNCGVCTNATLSTQEMILKTFEMPLMTGNFISECKLAKNFDTHVNLTKDNDNTAKRQWNKEPSKCWG